VSLHQAFRAELLQALPPASQALLESQSGPYASRVFTTVPVHIFFRALPPLTPPATLPALAIVCTLLSMPSHS
jgi:hypothetical protein